MSPFSKSLPSPSPVADPVTADASGGEAPSHRRRRYAIVTPCRDEAEFLEAAIGSLVDQSVPPIHWVIVDDGSTDDTPRIAAAAAARHPFIEVVTRRDRGGRKVGPGVIEAFYEGLARIDLDRVDFICKMDADLELPHRYFERLMEEMDREPRLGAVSGKMFLRDDRGRLHHERRGDDHAAGPTKFYRVDCFREIGGFVRMVGWDGIDGHRCRQLGWMAESIMDDELKVVHLRRMGSSQVGVLTGRVRGGEGKWRIGSSPWYLLATTVYRLFDPPFVVGGLSMAFGYFRAMLAGVPRMDDPTYLRHLRRYEWSVLLRGRRRARLASDRRIRRLAETRT